MSTFVTPAIPASQLVSVIPSVLPSGGDALDTIGLLLTQDPRFPIGQVMQFADTADVEDYVGPTDNIAALASIYFNGPDNSTKLPGALLIAQYPELAVAGYLRSGSFAGVSLATLQTVNASLTISIDSTPETHSVNLAAATSFSNAAVLIASQMSLTGVPVANVTAALSGTVMTVDAVNYGPEEASFTASLSSTTMTVTALNSGSIAVGQVVVGTGIGAGVTIAALGSGTGGIGTYTLSAAVTTETAEAIVAYSPTALLAVGQVVSGTGLTAGTYIASLGTGTGGLGTYNLSIAATTESDETVIVHAPAVTYDPNLEAFVIASGTTGASSSVSFGTNTAATSLKLTAALGALQSPGAAATSPGVFMPSVTAITQNWVSFMTDWEPIESDKEAFATWNQVTKNRYVYEMWNTSAVNTGSNGPTAAVAFVTAGDLSGIDMLYQDPNISLVPGEKAMFEMSWTACLDFTRRNGRQTAAYKKQSGLVPDVRDGTVALNLAGIGDSYGYGINFYGDYTTANQAFFGWQRGLISGDFKWKDSYVNQIWLNNALQLAIMTGLSFANSVPYNQVGYATIESWIADPINAAVNFGAIVPGVVLSQQQINAVNAAAGFPIDTILTQRGWYVQVTPASAITRRSRSSPPCTLWYCDGGSIQSIVLASIEIQ